MVDAAEAGANDNNHIVEDEMSREAKKNTR